MDPNYPPDHNVHAPHRRIPRQTQLGVVFALESYRAALDHGHSRLETRRPRLLQARDLELVDAVGESFGGGVDGLAELVGGELPAKDAGGLGVEDGVFVSGWREVVGGEHDVGRVEGEVVELGEGGQVDGWACRGRGGGDGADPTDGPGDDACLGLEKVMDVKWSGLETMFCVDGGVIMFRRI